MKRIVVINLTVALMLILAIAVNCDSNQTPRSETTTMKLAPIKNAINGMCDAYNEGDFSKALTYCTNFGDEDERITEMAAMKELTGSVTIVGISVNASDSSATATITLSIAGQTKADEMKLVKIDSDWKIDMGEGFSWFEPIDNPQIPELTEIEKTRTTEIALSDARIQEIIQGKQYTIEDSMIGVWHTTYDKGLEKIGAVLTIDFKQTYEIEYDWPTIEYDEEKYSWPYYKEMTIYQSGPVGSLTVLINLYEGKVVQIIPLPFHQPPLS